LQITNAVESPSFKKRSGKAVQSPWQRSTIAYNVVTTQWEHPCGRQGLYDDCSVYASFTSIAQRVCGVHGDTKAFALRLHEVFTLITQLHRLHCCFY
jgi:hypothetical protein